jgi:predicted small secreted protein
MNILRLLLILTVAAFSMASCDSDDGVAEKAGEAMDKTGEKIEQAATNAGNAIEDACENAKEGVGADDTDC